MVKSKEHIVAAIDFSAPSAEALRESVRISASRGAQLTALHVVDSRVMEGMRERINIDESELVAETKKRLAEFVGRAVRSDGEIQLEVVAGHPFDELLKAVKRLDATLLVMGAHGSGDDPLRVGMIASKCVRKAPVDVLLVRELHHGKQFRKVLACIDFSENSKRAARSAIEFAKRDGAPIEFLNIYQPLCDRAPMADYIGGGQLVSDEEVMDANRENLQQLVATLLEDSPEVEHTEVVKRSASIAGGISDHVQANGIDLLALGTRGRTGLKVLLLGTTAEKVIHAATCSTLAVKPEGFHYEHA